jgi:hypothetical protein
VLNCSNFIFKNVDINDMLNFVSFCFMGFYHVYIYNNKREKWHEKERRRKKQPDRKYNQNKAKGRKVTINAN